MGSRNIYIDLLLVVCWNVNSPECATHWDKTVLFIMDKIALFHFNNLLVVIPVMGFLKHSRMPAIVICISMTRHLSVVATQHCYFTDMGTVLERWNVKCTRLSLSYRCRYTRHRQQLLRQLHNLSVVYL